jgi:hypothetical protein
MPSDKHLSLMQSLELNLTNYYNEQPQLIDFDVSDAFNALVRHYKAKLENRSFTPNLKGRSKEVFEMLQAIGDAFVSSGLYPGEDNPDSLALKDMESYTLEDVLSCFKRLQSSLKLWTKEGGRQGYLNYISQFV